MAQKSIEISVLGALIDGFDVGYDGAPEILSTLKPEYFTGEFRDIFNAIVNKHIQNTIIDASSIGSPFGDEMVKLLRNESGNYLKLEDYIEVMIEMYKKRMLNVIRSGITKELEKSTDPEIIISKIEDNIMKIREEGGYKAQPQRSVMNSANEIIENAANGKGIEGINITFSKNLARLIYKIKRSDYILIAADTSVGKTTFCLNMLDDFSRQGKTGLFFSFEMQEEELSVKLLALRSGVYLDKIFQGRINQTDYRAIKKAQEEMSEMNVFWDTSYPNINQLQSSIINFTAKHGKPDFIMIDYLQKIESKEKNAYEKSVDVSNTLQKIAKKLKIPTIVLAQLARKDQRTDKPAPPRLHDLKGGSHIEQDADIVIFLYRKDPTPEDIELQGLIVAKNRLGGFCGETEITLNKAYGKYSDPK